MMNEKRKWERHAVCVHASEDRWLRIIEGRGVLGYRPACRAFEVDPHSIIDPGTAAWSEDDQPGDLDPRWEEAWEDAVEAVSDATGDRG